MSGRSRHLGETQGMDLLESHGRKFEMIMASDLLRDGMALELTELTSSRPGPVIEAFWHDNGTGFDFIVHHAGHDLPFDVVEQFVAVARKRLPYKE